eukprot:Hpha_TRINITY_DN31013_c0_g1::TRINITY_DN31013_c0_g1_i1::g.63911::m.63911/K06041/kdsD, kpsF; arabinose-5-phosphate isomerase
MRRSFIRFCVARSLRQDLQALTATLQLAENGGLSRQVEGAAAAVHRAAGSRVITTGVGKSGKVAERLAVSLLSLGAPAQFIHAQEWGHGDLGALSAPPAGWAAPPVVIGLSHSGSTQEVVAALKGCRERCEEAVLVALVGNEGSTMESLSDIAIVYSLGVAEEPLQTVPTCSVVAQEAVSNCVIRRVAALFGLDRDGFRRNHPGGAIGQRLASRA